MYTFETSTRLPFPPETVWNWHAEPGASARLAPPWLNATLERTGGILNGARTEIVLKKGPFVSRYLSLHIAHEIGRSFIETQLEGPFGSWRHEHNFLPTDNPEECELVDRVRWSLPYPRFDPIFQSMVLRDIQRSFTFWYQRIRNDLERHRGIAPMVIAATDPFSRIGAELLPFLGAGGHSILKVVEGSSDNADEISWDPAKSRFDARQVEGIDAFLHLCGGELFQEGRKKQLISTLRQQHLQSTQFLAASLAALKKPPKVLILASTTAFYGDRGEEILEEDALKGSGELADFASALEEAVRPAIAAGIRVVQLRIAPVLCGRWGLLSRCVDPLQFFSTGGIRWQPWIAIDDLLGIFLKCIVDNGLSGPVHAVAPTPIRWRDFMRILGRITFRTPFLPLPSWMLRQFGGEWAELTTMSQRLLPRKLLETDFRFDFPELETALRFELGRSSYSSADRSLPASNLFRE